MVRPSLVKNVILALLADGKPRSYRDIIRGGGLREVSVRDGLYRYWRQSLILRTKKPIYRSERVFKGRGGFSRSTRPYHLYVLRPEGRDKVFLNGYEFVAFDRKYMDARGGGKKKDSKAQKIFDFLKENREKAWFSKKIAETLKDEGVRVCDVMSNVRRFEKKGMVYVRGYESEDRQTPFREGYLITWMDRDSDKPREQAIEEAIQRTNRALEDRSSSSPIVERIHRTRDIIIEHSKLRRLVSFPYLQNKLGCTEYEAENAIKRTLQLYPDLKYAMLFNAYRYYFHASLAEEDLKAAIEMKKNYIRIAKGRANRIGHNWEAAAEWFIDMFTTGAHFLTQDHRNKGMDPRRITLHLIRGVGGRRNAAEVDRVWEVTPGVFAPPITYVLSCKWGLVNREHMDDFLEVLRWSKEFGVDTPDGRQIKQGVYGVFAGGAFNPRENVQLKDGRAISLASYAARMNMQLLKATDFNSKLRERGCPSIVTVQKICKIVKDEGEVREVLDAIWDNSWRSKEILEKVLEKNTQIYKFEKMLEEKE